MTYTIEIRETQDPNELETKYVGRLITQKDQIFQYEVNFPYSIFCVVEEMKRPDFPQRDFVKEGLVKVTIKNESGGELNLSKELQEQMIANIFRAKSGMAINGSPQGTFVLQDQNNFLKGLKDAHTIST